MVASYIQTLEEAVSSARLSSYRSASNDDLETAVNYYYNVVLAESLYSCLNALEVILRNSIHSAATAHYGTSFWFNQPNVLKKRQPTQVRNARKSLTDQRKPQTDGRIIAELNFGFWTTLLSGPYHSTFWMPNQGAMLKAVFPNMKNNERVRQRIYDHYNVLRLLRNRVFHFEPIWNRPQLWQEHEDIIRAIGWINPTIRDSVISFDNFPVVYRNGRARVEAGIRSHLGIS